MQYNSSISYTTRYITDNKEDGSRLFEVLRNASTVGIVGHREPDGDCLGCMLAVSFFLSRHSVNHVPFCTEGDVSAWTFLPGSFRLTTDSAEWQRHKYDVLVFVDTPDVQYAGLDAWLSSQGDQRPFIVNIDHHHDNERFGDVNIVVGDAPACALIMYELFRLHRITIDRHMAFCLLCGVVADTHHFSNAATDGHVLHVAADLIRRGAPLHKVTDRLWKRHAIPTFFVWGKMLTRLERNRVWDTVTTVVPYEDIALHGSAEGMANFLNSVGEGKCALLLKEMEPGVLKGSFRTTRDDIDVSRLARLLGGGGHRRAAGFTLPGKLVQRNGSWRVV